MILKHWHICHFVSILDVSRNCINEYTSEYMYVNKKTQRQYRRVRRNIFVSFDKFLIKFLLPRLSHICNKLTFYFWISTDSQCLLEAIAKKLSWKIWQFSAWIFFFLNSNSKSGNTGKKHQFGWNFGLKSF